MLQNIDYIIVLTVVYEHVNSNWKCWKLLLHVMIKLVFVF